MVIGPKRGQMADVMVWGLAALIVAISFIFLVYIVQTVKTNFTASNAFNQTGVGINIISNSGTSLPGVMDGGFALFVIGSALILIASAAFVDTHPIFLPIFLLVYIISIVTNLVFANMIDDFGSATALVSTYSQFPMMYFFASNWIYVTIVTGILTIVAFFGGKGIRGG
jgi:hypothetical protein